MTIIIRIIVVIVAVIAVSLISLGHNESGCVYDGFVQRCGSW
jgi:hypothetical protein